MKKEKSVRYIVAVLILLVIVIILFILFNGRETRTSEGGENESVTALYCTAGNLEEAFFTSTTANTIKNEIKVTFKNNKMDRLFYTYKGTYRSTEVARDDEAVLHAKYNIYMGENHLIQESLSPSYSVANSKFNLTLYIDDYSKINPATAVFFFIGEDKIAEFQDYTIDKMKTFYEDQGFQCQISE